MADFTVIAEFDWSKVADDGVSEAHIPEIDFLIELKFITKITGKRRETKNDVAFLQNVDILLDSLGVYAYETGNLVVTDLGTNLEG